MEDLCQEVALQELNTPPRDPSPTPWGNPVGNSDPNVDDQEVIFPRGRVGTPRTTTSTSCPPQSDGGEEPRGQPPCPPAPAQPNHDVGCLIKTLATGLQLDTPHINTFSGEAMPGKMEVLFEQWYHEVQCIKDHYLESVVRESIVHSLKGATADRARYMGPTTSIAHILQKLTVIFGTVVSFDVLMQNFYKVIQSNYKNIPSFAMRLEGTLNQTRLQCPGRITDWEVQQYLKDCLFHGVCKHMRDSIQYLYSNPGTMYSQFMVNAHKTESKKWKTLRQGVG